MYNESGLLHYAINVQSVHDKALNKKIAWTHIERAERF